MGLQGIFWHTPGGGGGRVFFKHIAGPLRLYFKQSWLGLRLQWEWRNNGGSKVLLARPACQALSSLSVLRPSYTSEVREVVYSLGKNKTDIQLVYFLKCMKKKLFIFEHAKNGVFGG